MNIFTVDAWGQPPLQKFFERMPEVHRLRSQSGASERRLSPEELIAQMDEAGINVMMLSAWCRPEKWVISNEDIYKIVSKYPERFAGIATVNLGDPVQAVRDLDYAIKTLGFKALRIVPWLWKLPPNDKLYYPLYVKCIELDIPFCTQVGHTGPLMPSETGRPIPYLDEVALTFPDLKIVGGHIGYPWTDEMIALTWKHRNVYIDTSAYLPKVYPPQLVSHIQGLGARKVLFGTNYPQLKLSECTKQVEILDIKPTFLKRFMGENARQLFKLG